MLGHEGRFLGHGAEGLRELDITHAKRCGELAKRAEELRVFFLSWETADPGPEGRLAGVMRLRDLESETKVYMPPF